MRPYYYLGKCRGLTQLSSGQMFIVNTEARDIATWIIHMGCWETFVDDILCALAEPGGTFFDIGANMGYYTIKIGSLVGATGKTFSFEPNPDLFEVLNDNVNINGFASRSTIFNAAAGDAAGASTLLFERRYPGGGQVGLGAEYQAAHHTRIDVDVLRIDDVTPADCVADLIKIDVEGFEPLVLRGMAGLLARSPQAAIVTEVSYAQWARFGDPAAMLREVAGDRQVFCIHTDGRLEPLPADIDHALDRTFVSYILMLPRSEAAMARIARFLPNEAAPAAPPPSDPAPEPVALPRRGLLSRAGSKLKRMAAS
jgi:FkbM family methyltransferase